MRIIFHHRTQGKGVEGVHIAGVINGMRELGHSVSEVALISALQKTSSVGVSGSKSGAVRRIMRWISAHAPNRVFRSAEIGYNFIAFARLAAEMARGKYDILYERYAYFNFAGMLAGRLFNIPVILEVNVVTTLNDVRKLEFASLAYYIEKKVLRAADAIFVVSHFLKDYLISQGIDGLKVHVQPNAFTVGMQSSSDDSGIRRGWMQCIEGKVVIGFLGRLLPWYGLDSLLRAFRAVHERYPVAHLVLVGDGTERHSLELLSKDMGIEENISFVGSVTHEEAMSILAAFDIGVIPSTNQWGSPMKLFEYMGMGIPVVAPELSVITAIMQDGVHGRAFPYNDFKKFESALEDLIVNAELRKKMGANARRHIIENHTWEKVAEHVLAVACRILTKEQTLASS